MWHLPAADRPRARHSTGRQKRQGRAPSGMPLSLAATSTRRPGIRDDVADLLDGEHRTDRIHHGTGLGDRVVGDEPLPAVRSVQRDPVTGLHADRDETVGDTVRHRVQLREAERLRLRPINATLSPKRRAASGRISPIVSLILCRSSPQRTPRRRPDMTDGGNSLCDVGGAQIARSGSSRQAQIGSYGCVGSASPASSTITVDSDRGAPSRRSMVDGLPGHASNSTDRGTWRAAYRKASATTTTSSSGPMTGRNSGIKSMGDNTHRSANPIATFAR